MVLSTDAEAFGCIVYAEVDRHHVKIIFCNKIAIVRIGKSGELPVTILIEDCLAHSKLSLCIQRAAVQSLRICCRITNIHIPDSLEVVQVGSLDLSFACRQIFQTVILELIVQRKVCKVSGESPGRSVIQSCRSKGLCQIGSELLVDLIDSCVDVVCDLLKSVQILNVIHRRNDCVVHRAVVLKDGLVVDKAVSFIAVCNACDLAVVFYCKALIGHVIVNLGILQIIDIICIGLCICSASDIENSRCLALCQLRLKCCLVLSVCSSQNRNISAKIIVNACKLLPCIVCLRLEVQKIYSSGRNLRILCSFCLFSCFLGICSFCLCSRFCRCGRLAALSCAAAAASKNSADHGCTKNQCQYSLFHSVLSFLGVEMTTMVFLCSLRLFPATVSVSFPELFPIYRFLTELQEASSIFSLKSALFTIIPLQFLCRFYLLIKI